MSTGPLQVAAGDGAWVEGEDCPGVQGCGKGGAVVQEDDLLADRTADEAGGLKGAGGETGRAGDGDSAGEGEVAVRIRGGGLQ